MKEYAALRQQLPVKPPPTTEGSDTNGSLVDNGHPTLCGGQANDRLIGNTSNGHLVADANGHIAGRNHASVTDRPYPEFSKTVGASEPNIVSPTRENEHNAEVRTLHVSISCPLRALVLL